MKYEAGISPHGQALPDREDFARAKAMFAAGEGVEHIVMGQWLLTWGKPDFLDFPDWLSAQNG